MLFTSLAGGLAILASSTSAIPFVPSARAAQATNPPLEITNLTLTDAPAGNTSITFLAYNPDPLANTTATCNETWSHEKQDWPSDGDAARCGTSTFAWHIVDYTDIKNFTIALQHNFVDPAVGKPPYDRVTVFAKSAVNETVIAYEDEGDQVAGNLIEGEIIYLPIYAIIA